MVQHKVNIHFLNQQTDEINKHTGMRKTEGEIEVVREKGTD